VVDRPAMWEKTIGNGTKWHSVAVRQLRKNILAPILDDGHPHDIISMDET
jgi:hypothetical protein